MAPAEYTATQLVASLETAGLAPDLDLLRACLAQKEALRPHLLEMLANNPYEKYDLPPDSDDPRSVVDIHAGHLLLAFKEPAALPLFAEIYRDETREHLVEWFNPWLHAYGAVAVDTLISLVGDEDAYWFGRAGATEVLSSIGRRFPETREEIVAGLQGMLPTPADGDPLPPAQERDEIWTWIAMALSELNAEATLPQIRALYEAGLIVEDITGDLDEYLALYGEASPEPRPFNLLDTYRYLQHRVEQEQARKRAERAARRRQMGQGSPGGEYERSAPGEPTVRAVPKVGRNEPCPCGSGRKYKHCHGRPGR